MIDNSELIKSLFYFNEANNMFFHCQIVQRNKDFPNKKVKEGSLKTYFIRSREHLDKLMPEIRLLCEYYQARAYINVGGKDFELVNKLMLSELARLNLSKDINNKNPRRLLNSCAGSVKSREPHWIVDIDSFEDKEKVTYAFNHWESSNPFGDLIYAEIPTVQGCHLVTRPFNVEWLHNQFPDIMVHKNSMGTLLYYPKSLNKQ